jgi:hypothetical protein
MAYSNTITALDFSSGVGNVRVSAGYTWSVVGGPSGPVDQKQEGVPSLDIPSNIFQPGPHTFAYARDLVPTPSQAWFVALWIQEIPRIANDTGWLFRSGSFTTEPPTDPIEVIVAQESLIGATELAGAVAVPVVSGSTTITAVTLTVAGQDIALTATGTDTGLPHGDTFTFTASLVLIPNDSVQDVNSPFDIRLTNGSLTFAAGVGQGFVTFLLNAISGIVLSNIAPKIKESIKNSLNSGILNNVATRVNRGVPTSMPQGVVLSIRSVRATTRTTATGATESVIGINGALAAFGGVINKFPALSTGGGGCFIATASVGPNAPELQVLRTWRDEWLRPFPAGPKLISMYERLSPPLARFIAVSSKRRAVVRRALIMPAVSTAHFLLRRASNQSKTCAADEVCGSPRLDRQDEVDSSTT